MTESFLTIVFCTVVILNRSVNCPNNSADSLPTAAYHSDWDTTYILIPPSTGGTTSESQSLVTLSCKQNSCMRNSYLSSATGNCQPCPPNHLSDHGSTALGDCSRCPAGTFIDHKYATACTLSTNYTEFPSLFGWRIWTTPEHIPDSTWLWDVSEIEFYDNVGCTGDAIPNSGSPIDSGNAGDAWGPEQAFGGGGTWGGRQDEDGAYWIGMQFENSIAVKCVRVLNYIGGAAAELQVQV